MSTIIVQDLHLTESPDGRLAEIAQNRIGQCRVIVRVPDRASDGIRALRVEDVARMLHRHGRVLELGVTDGGTICAAVDIVRRRGTLAVWTGQAIGPWHPSDITDRGLGGSETAAVRLAEQLAEMDWAVTLYGQFEQTGLSGDVMLRHHTEFDCSQPLDVLIGFRDARLFEHRPNAGTRILWLEDLAPAEGLTPRRASNLDRVCAVSGWHKRQVLDAHPWLAEDQVAACRNGIVLDWFEDED